MSIKSIFFGPEEKPNLAEQISWEIKVLKGMPDKKISSDELLAYIEKLHNEVKNIKREGISMWNYKQAIPKIFDVVDGAFVVMTEVVKKLGEKE